MKLVLITIVLLTISVLVTYLIRKEKNQKQQELQKPEACEIQENLATETSVTIPKVQERKEKPKRKYTKKSTSIKTSAKKKSK